MKYLKTTLILCLLPTISIANSIAPVNVTVAPTCSLENLSVDLGVYNKTTGNEVNAFIKHSCSPEVSYTISVEGSLAKKLTHTENPSETANLYLYQGTNKNKYFGTSSNSISAVGTGEVISSPILVSATANQNLLEGKYRGIFNMYITY